MALPNGPGSDAAQSNEPGSTLAGVFLQRQSYRRRRLLDGLKMLPILGAWLFLLPAFWSNAVESELAETSMSSALIYVFGVWVLLIVLAFGFLRGYRALANTRSEDGIEPPTEQSGDAP